MKNIKETKYDFEVLYFIILFIWAIIVAIFNEIL